MRAFLAATVAAVGLAGCGGSSPSPQPVTFNKDIAPILYANCATCHRPGGVAPFSLLTHAEAAEQADAIATQTSKRHMPPWLPERGDVPFVGERRLTADQIDAIARWVKGGAVEGAPADRPTPPSFPDGWELGTPDVIATTDRPYVIKAGSDDVYRNLVMRVPITEAVFVRAVEFRTNGAPVHHAVIRVDPTSSSRRRDGEDGQPGFDGMVISVRDPGGQFIGWAPGRGPIVSPEGMAWRLERGADLVVELHVIDAKKDTPLKPSIGIFTTKTPPKQKPITVRLSSKSIDIPAGKSDYVVTDEYELPANVTLLSVYPHAHYLGDEMRATATLPGGTVKTLLHIPHWDFHWQQDYRYVTPISLPKGTKIAMRYTFDNSRANPDNPSNPPVRVRSGPRAIDEMAEFSLQLLTESIPDAVRLLTDFDRKDKLSSLAMAEGRVRDDAENAENRGFLGSSLVEVGRFEEALPHLQAAQRLGDKTALTHNYLGVATMSLGRLSEAVAHFRRAAMAAPRDEAFLFNLGKALNDMGRIAEAEAAYRKSVALNPDYADGHLNLAALLAAKGRLKEALPHFERAAALNPDSVLAQSNLGGALAMAGRYSEAMAHIRLALEIDPSYAPALDNLRRLQRMGIRQPRP
jgi:tetratricopeptide (TPR) repeat protein/mono/diheme cytochrome c family protein